jgi:predicted amidophosphoribosyltransferase
VAAIHPTRIPGRWREGFALDAHTLSSDFVGHDEFGHPRFETKRTELDELLYRLKYGSDTSVVDEISDAAAEFLNSWNPRVTLILPVPASKARSQQPVILMAEALARRAKLPMAAKAVKRIKPLPELKDVYEYDARVKLLLTAHAVDRAATVEQRILLFDDLFRSGATMNAITTALYEDGQAGEVFALTITRTRSRS